MKVVKRAILLARLLNKASIQVKINHNMIMVCYPIEFIFVYL